MNRKSYPFFIYSGLLNSEHYEKIGVRHMAVFMVHQLNDKGTRKRRRKVGDRPRS